MKQAFSNRDEQVIIILVGPKGAGKSYIGRLLEEKYGIIFLHVEKIFMEVKKLNLSYTEYAEKGYQLVKEGLDTILKDKHSVVFETTGVADEFLELLNYLKKTYKVFLIKVQVSSQLALERVYNRNQTDQIQLERDVVAKLNEQSQHIRIDYDFVIENENATDEQLIHQINTIWKLCR